MPTVTVDHLPESARKYVDSNITIVVVDVIRFTTTAVTAIQNERLVYPVSTTDEAFYLRRTLDPTPLLAGELGGNVPFGFDLTNSPVQVTALDAVPCGEFTNRKRSIVLVSSSGSQLFDNAKKATALYVCSLRNLTATATHLVNEGKDVVVLGAGTRGEFRLEDQLCCYWLADLLVSSGFDSDSETTALAGEWRHHDVSEVRKSPSADYLKSTGQVHDLEYVVSHVNDTSVVALYDTQTQALTACKH